MEANDKIGMYQIVHSEETSAIEWIVDSASKYTGNPRSKHITEYALFRKQRPAINIALAQYGTYRPLLRRFMDHGSKAVRIALFSNPLIGPGDGGILDMSQIAALFESFSKNRDYIEILFQKTVNPTLIADSIHGNNQFSRCSDHQRFLVISAILKNDALFQEMRGEGLSSEWSSSGFSPALRSLAEVVATCPLNQDWAELCVKIIARLPYKFHFPDVSEATIQRWQIEPAKSRKAPDLYNSFWLRHSLARRFAYTGELDKSTSFGPRSGDKAIRLGFFRGAHPADLLGDRILEPGFEYPSFQKQAYDYKEYSKVVYEDVSNFFGRDGADFVREIIKNRSFWARREDRDFLRTIVWDIDVVSEKMVQIQGLFERRELGQGALDDDFGPEGPSAEQMEELKTHLEGVIRLSLKSAPSGDNDELLQEIVKNQVIQQQKFKSIQSGLAHQKNDIVTSVEKSLMDTIGEKIRIQGYIVMALAVLSLVQIFSIIYYLVL